MIAKVIFALAPIGIILALSEFLWRKHIIRDEQGRKFIHIITGVWMAFWPFYLPLDGIFILSCMVLTVVLYSRFTNLFHAIYDVRRRTYGDVLYALALVVCSYFGQRDWIFVTSILLLALADGAAAAAGYYWGARNSYHWFGIKALKKSIAGTTAFLLFAYVSVAVGWLLGGSQELTGSYFAFFLFVPLTATLLESAMPYGIDNFVVPVFATIALNALL